MQQILLAEDDHRLAALVRDYLTDNGFEVAVEDRGDRVPERVRQLQPDLLILDIMLPGKDGLTLCRELRPAFTGPIMMLTARNEDADQILGLEFGADDYVIKPAEPRILLARIRALLRRIEPGIPSTPQTLSFGTLEVHHQAFQSRVRPAVVARPARRGRGGSGFSVPGALWAAL